MKRLNGKVAVITGAASGMGRAATRLFLEEGARVVAADCAGQVEQGHAALVHVRMDVTREEEVADLVRTAARAFGGIDILFNNAGIEISAPVTEMTQEAWQRCLDVNLRGVFFCCKHAIPEMLRRGAGSIVNNASINAIRGNIDMAAYCASKGGVTALSRALALEWAPRIRVNAVCPGTIEDTRMLQDKLAASSDPAGLRASYVAKHPMGRMGKAEEVAYAVLFLASDEASFITGVTLPVDGGRSIR
jgi:NAD(P)-dependent dehydrogenase (short-subunit alcohol dehydrogenase family)